MKKEVSIVSDLWGIKKSDWLLPFQQQLSPNYTIKFYDACELGEIDLQFYEEKNIHQQFIEFGIEKAVSKLLRLEQQAQLYIGCSIGGLIAWKAALRGLPIEKLIAISATRLRKEKEKPSCPVQLYFGKQDPYQPSQNWYEQMGSAEIKILEGDHHIYKDPLTVKQILQDF